MKLDHAGSTRSFKSGFAFRTGRTALSVLLGQSNRDVCGLSGNLNQSISFRWVWRLLVDGDGLAEPTGVWTTRDAEMMEPKGVSPMSRVDSDEFAIGTQEWAAAVTIASERIGHYNSAAIGKSRNSLYMTHKGGKLSKGIRFSELAFRTTEL
jgi:hypothetical protein